MSLVQYATHRKIASTAPIARTSRRRNSIRCEMNVSCVASGSVIGAAGVSVWFVREPNPAPTKPATTHPLNVIVATDCGSTTTKAILIEKVGDEYRQTYRGEAPTTVEAPFEDVTRGVLNAIAEIEELSGRKILDGDKIITPCCDAKTGVDIYISTSSAGGGLQMMVTGVVQNMTGESAQRAALGAGAIVIDVLASNDGRLPHEKIERIRTMRPDMILMSGGTDGGAVTHVVEMAEYISAAEPHPRFGGDVQASVDLCGQQRRAAASKEDFG